MMPEVVTHNYQILNNRWDCTFCHASGPNAQQNSYLAFPEQDGTSVAELASPDAELVAAVDAGQRRAAGQNQEIERRAQSGARFGLVLAALPFGIVANGVHHHLAPDAVAADDRHRLAGERHESVHEFGMCLGPHPRVHAAHRRAHDEPQVIDLEAVGHERVLGGDHVLVAVVRELGAHPVARLGRAAVADIVGENHEVRGRVERLAGGEACVPIWTIRLLRRAALTIARNYGILFNDSVALRGLFLIDTKGIIRHAVINDLPLGRSVDEAIRMVSALQFVETHGDQVCPANWNEGEEAMKPTAEGVASYLANHA